MTQKADLRRLEEELGIAGSQTKVSRECRLFTRWNWTERLPFENLINSQLNSSIKFVSNAISGPSDKKLKKRVLRLMFINEKS